MTLYPAPVALLPWGLGRAPPTHLGMSHWGQAQLPAARPPPPPQGVVFADLLGFAGKHGIHASPLGKSAMTASLHQESSCLLWTGHSSQAKRCVWYMQGCMSVCVGEVQIAASAASPEYQESRRSLKHITQPKGGKLSFRKGRHLHGTQSWNQRKCRSSCSSWASALTPG